MKTIIFAIFMTLFSMSMSGQMIMPTMDYIQAESAPDTSWLHDDLFYWADFKEPSGTTFVDELGNHNGTIGGTLSVEDGDSAHYFKYTSNSIPDHDDFTLNYTDFAIGFLIKPDTYTGSQYIIGKYPGEWFAFLDYNHRLIFRMYNLGTSTYHQQYTPNAIDDNTWHYVVINVVDASDRYSGYEIWIDGVNQAITDINSTVTLSNTTNDVRVGITSGLGFYDGYMAKLQFWKDSLNSTQIGELYNSGTPIEYDDLITP